MRLLVAFGYVELIARVCIICVRCLLSSSMMAVKNNDAIAPYLTDSDRPSAAPIPTKLGTVVWRTLPPSHGMPTDNTHTAYAERGRTN